MKKTLGTLLTVAAALVATSIQAQCPEITINEKYDTIPTPQSPLTITTVHTQSSPSLTTPSTRHSMPALA